MECLGLHNKPKAVVHLLMDPKEEEEEEEEEGEEEEEEEEEGPTQGGTAGLQPPKTPKTEI
jgi:hypothetical protein